jgi:hypothetical protein
MIFSIKKDVKQAVGFLNVLKLAEIENRSIFSQAEPACEQKVLRREYWAPAARTAVPQRARGSEMHEPDGLHGKISLTSFPLMGPRVMNPSF